MRRVLIADSNLPFATMVAEELQRLGDYRAVVSANGPETLQLSAAFRPDVIVIDGELPQCQVPQLITQLRQVLPALPVILIPVGTTMLPEGIPIQATLAKPFFLPDLTTLLNQLLGADLSAHSTEILNQRVLYRPATNPPTVEPASRKRLTNMLTSAPPTVMLDLRDDLRRATEKRVEMMSRALRDEPVFLTQHGKVIVMAPRLSASAAQVLANVAGRAWSLPAKAESRSAAPEAAPEVLRFEGNSEINRYMLYSIAVTRTVYLSVALRVRIPLPIVRRIARETAAELSQLITA
ncbi:MAG: response regulator [Anaerolineales bacterium]